MLTRSKQRALAAESSEGQKGLEGSSSGMKLPTDWTELPAELLMMIFENLTIERRSSKEQRKSLLSCRLVHPRWKSAMEDLLENKCLSFWKQMVHFNNPYEFSVVYFHPSGKQTVQNVVFPAFLQGYNESCPFPSNSVCLTFAPICMDNWVLSPKRDPHFFSKYGQHLTSLTIKGLNRRKDFTAETLQQLLSCTPNLKAMTLQNTDIKLLERDVGKVSLPPLPHLEHVRVNGVYSRGFRFNVQNWILEFYKEQLISVECNKELGCENSAATFPLLKQLQLWGLTPRQLLAAVVFPSLKSLDLMYIKLNEEGRHVTLEQVFKYLCVMASKLVELNLDIIKDRRSKTNPIDYEKDQSFQEVRKIKQSRFPALKKLAIFYPKYVEEVKVVKDVLKMFPNLEVLKFTRFGKYGMTPTELHRSTVRKHLKKEQYQGVCPRLKTINVYMTMEDGRRPVSTTQFPFSN